MIDEQFHWYVLMLQKYVMHCAHRTGIAYAVGQVNLIRIWYTPCILIYNFARLPRPCLTTSAMEPSSSLEYVESLSILNYADKNNHKAFSLMGGLFVWFFVSSSPVSPPRILLTRINRFQKLRVNKFWIFKAGCVLTVVVSIGLTLEEMDEVFGATKGYLAAADQERQDAIFRRLGLFNDEKVQDRKSDEESNEKKEWKSYLARFVAVS